MSLVCYRNANNPAQAAGRPVDHSVQAREGAQLGEGVPAHMTAGSRTITFGSRHLTGLTCPASDPTVLSQQQATEQLEPEVKEAFTTLTRLNTKTLPSAFEYLSSYKEQLPERQAILEAPIQERQLVYQKETLQSPEQAFDQIA